MGMSVFDCFFSSSGNKESSFQLSTKDLNAFYCSYSEDLNQLGKSLSHGSVSLQWSVEAMKILKKMQVELLVLIRKSNLPISSGAEDGWFNQYMKDSISMLDFCNSLKFTVSRVDQCRIMADIMIKKLNKNGCWFTVSSEIERQKYSVKKTVRKGSRIEDEGSCTEAKSAMDMVSVLLHSAIVSPVSTEFGGCDLACRYPQLKPFMENSLGSALVEHEMVGRVMVDIQAQVIEGIEDKERFLTSLELLRTSSVDLKEGIEMLDAAVDDVFDVVFRGRNEMLGVIRDRDLSIG